MNFEIHHTIVLKALDARTIQLTGSMGSVENRSREVERMTHEIGEYVIALIVKENDRLTKRLPR